MKILLDVYLDRNIGDDMMILTTAKKLSEHEFFVRSEDKCALLAFRDAENISEYSGEDVDAVITVGGSMFELGSTKVILKRLRTTVKQLRKYRRSGKKIATVGCNLGHVNRKLAEYAVRAQLRQSQLVTLRDRRSSERLKKIGVEAQYYPDMLFCAKMPRFERRSGLAISVYRSVTHPENNLACCKKYAQIADEYIRLTGQKVRLIAFDCDSENDISAAYTVAMLMNYSEMAEIVAYTGEPEPVLGAVASSSCMLGTRFHSIVFSLASGVPVLPVGYSDKTYGMLEDLGYSGFRLDHAELESADAQMIAQKLADPEELMILPPRRLEEVKYKAKGHLEALSQFLNSEEK